MNTAESNHATQRGQFTLSLPRRVFVNRTIDLGKVSAIGFDMDYTLCRYHPALEVLACRLAVDHLVRRGYPAALKSMEFDPTWGIRGLVIDCARGNVVKMDAHRHVTRAWHGLRQLPDEERREIYHADPPRLSADRWVHSDTLFATPETWLYAQLVQMLEDDAKQPLGVHETRRLYADIRYCVDLVHRDDSLKSAVRADMPHYVEKDPHLAQALHRLRSAGKRLFLLTNSDHSYTEHVMSYLLDGQMSGYRNWQDYFESVWVSAGKPTFFSRMVEPIELAAKGFDRGGRVHLEKRLGVSGDQILYVGDHIYGDVLKASSTTGWRTALVVPELEPEMDALHAKRDLILRRSELEDLRFELESALASAELNLRQVRRAERTPNRDTEALVLEREALRSCVADFRSRVAQTIEQIASLTAEIEKPHNQHWGQLLKERHKHSLFGAQMKSYACLYTSRVSNFAAYSPEHHFQPPRDLLPHERSLQLQRREQGNAPLP